MLILRALSRDSKESKLFAGIHLDFLGFGDPRVREEPRIPLVGSAAVSCPALPLSNYVSVEL